MHLCLSFLILNDNLELLITLGILELFIRKILYISIIYITLYLSLYIYNQTLT